MSLALAGLLVVLAIAILAAQWIRRGQLRTRRQDTGQKVGAPSPVAIVLLVLIIVGIVVLTVTRK